MIFSFRLLPSLRSSSSPLVTAPLLLLSWWIIIVVVATTTNGNNSSGSNSGGSGGGSSSSTNVLALSNNNNNNRTTKPIPITILSGFLGTGKTTLLQNMLQNKEGLKIAVIVNDVASVNIDSKLVARRGSSSILNNNNNNNDDNNEKDIFGSDGMVELQNGCACCSLSDELLTSVSQLVTMSDLRADEEDRFDHIVVELSGVADPKSVRAKFQEAIFEQMPLMDRVQLDTMVTLIDASTFTAHFESTKLANREEMPELYYRNGKEEKEQQEQELKKKEEWMKDLPPKLLEVVMSEMYGGGARDYNAENNGVAELLVSQTETADLVVLNKEDLVDTDEMNRLKEIVAALNPRAKVVTTSYGKLSIQSVLAIAGGKGVVVSGAVDDHRDYVSAAVDAIEVLDDYINVDEDDDDIIIDDDEEIHSHSHSHDHNSNNEEGCADPDCTDTSHSHSHNHDCSDPDCTDSSHSHIHSHDHHDSNCSDPDCTDPSHSHSHEHSHDGVACADPDCTDPSHSHSHSHAHDNDSSSTTAHAGIGTFVYKARRPFHPGRLVTFLRYLPVVRGVPEIENGGDGDNNDDTSLDVTDEAKEALLATLRSKGFVWCANSHTDAMYWSHAGSSFDLSCLGSWWATLPRNQWPEGVDTYVLQDFDYPEHDDATNPIGVGDRRQEIVFIGLGFGNPMCQVEIGDALSQCLLDDEEYEEYKSLQSVESKLRTRFSNPIDSKVVSY